MGRRQQVVKQGKTGRKAGSNRTHKEIKRERERRKNNDRGADE